MLLEGLAGQLAAVVENSRAYARVKERDRLAALGAIKGAAQLLAETSGDAPPSDQEFVGIILEEVERLDRVVTSILDYARLRSGEVEPIDVNAAVRRTVQILAPSHGEEVDVVVELTDELPTVRIDPEQLRQVLMNLVTNAVQAMGGKGRVVVSTAYRRSARATWPVSLANGAVEVRVADTGPGISTKVLKNLFIPFFTTKATGTGLGLAISQRIVQNAGGTIDVQTSAGVGTTFSIVLPAAAALPESTRTAETTELPAA
ncbi:MAG: two-component system sensor histidine kinase NtrB [Polyangiales bacterium]